MKTLYERLVESLPDNMNNIDMKPTTKIVKNLMTEYELTNKDLFSFCICAVNFLEYYEEESMGDVMRECPKKYARANSDNTKAVAGALDGEKKTLGWTDEEQFVYYMKRIQQLIEVNFYDIAHFVHDVDRFEKVYRREIFVPIMLGCPVDDYDDSKFSDRKYLKSIVNVDNLEILKAYQEECWA